ncbi:MAG TPA: glycosyltransferase, partial [Candidatus Margulisiibacteriota bacterium]|nr:glycosyltransferase [Candidatus Margulisiibacteriota bacterium]
MPSNIAPLRPSDSPAASHGEHPVASRPDLSVVVPIFNEAENIRLLHERVSKTLAEMGRTYEVWYVDDGSADGSLEQLRTIAQQDPHVGVIELTRNFGQHAAVLAGFAAAQA